MLIPLVYRRPGKSHGPDARLDLPGLALAGTSLFGVVWGVVRGNTVGWGGPEIAGSLLTAAFVLWELRAPAPARARRVRPPAPATSSANRRRLRRCGARPGLHDYGGYESGTAFSAGLEPAVFAGAAVVAGALAALFIPRSRGRPRSARWRAAAGSSCRPRRPSPRRPPRRP